ncbi:dihydrolipoamide acetyltransferase family protein [Caldalkalibacillus mannanilyticus]|uniref:dihydrolipoamide acetyltransferase family protein n=1 Tax=Caldalkalibacillus mannanilyticus TaxID=1418 RepID=UPI0004681818|nr:dihydrolipoamide acetyltransferase family protein [Caldalkalibacillus mannanilyticus]
MATKVTMPQLGESVTEGTISKWLVKVGDRVKKYDSLCEVMTDKVNAEVPASFAGTVTEIVAQEEETIEVGGLICYIQEEGTAAVASATDQTSTAKSTMPQASVASDAPLADQSMRKRYSPAVLKLSQEHNIDLELVKGSGMGGRITRKDLLQIIESGEIPVPTQEAAQAPVSAQRINVGEAVSREVSHSTPPAKTVSLPVQAGDIEIPVTGIRKAIATKMVQSKHEAPHAWTMIEVDVTNLVQYRSKLKDEFKQKEGLNLTFLPFFIKATVEALKEFPIINSQWAGDKIIQKKDINISIAVATEDALFVPVIKNADEKNILGIAKSIDDLARKTRAGKLTPEEMQGGTFTVNNTGSFGSIQSTPIINYPQAAILSVESIVKRPVIIDGMIAVRDMVNLCLSLDHRILDGLVCGRFLQSIKKKLETIDETTRL